MKTIRLLLCAIAAAIAAPAALAQSFSSEVRLSAHAGPSITPAVAAVGSNVYVVWLENTANGPGGAYQADIWFSRSVDNGANFSAPVALTSTTNRNETLPVIAAGGTQVHIFYTDSVVNGDVYYRRSPDSGVNWVGEVQLTPSDGFYSRPTGAFVDASGNVHLGFYDSRPPANDYGQVFYTCSGDGGANWNTALNITRHDGIVDNEVPRFAQTADGTLYMLFRSSRDGMPQGGWPPFDHYLMRTANAVTTCGSVAWLSPAQKVSPGLPEEFATTYGANISAGTGNALHVSYWSGKLGNNLLYRRGFPVGVGWESLVDVSEFGANHLEWDGIVSELTSHGVAEDAAGKLHAVFGDNDHLTEGFQSGRVFYRCSNDGVAWSTKQFVTGSTNTAQSRSAYANGRFHMVWIDWRDNNFGAEIYYRNVATGSCGGGRALTDMNGDAKSDLLYRNTTTGQIWRLLMSGFSVTSAAQAYHEPNTAWRVIADADFTGEGVSDLLYRNTSTGQVFMQNFNTSGMPAGGSLIYTEPNAAWKIVHTPDFNGDGKADLLWWNSSTGQVYGMIMDGFSSTGAGFIYTEPNTNWRIGAVGDFSGSGKRNQLMWHNSSTGQVYLMTVNFTSGVFSQTGVMVYLATPPYVIVGAGDFNGDGKSDLLWRNPTTGQVYMMLFNGAAITSEGVVYHEPNTAWKIVSVGDYNGDGKSDMLYRNDTTGQVFMVLMNGLGISGAAMVYQEANTAWKLLGPTEYAAQ